MFGVRLVKKKLRTLEYGIKVSLDPTQSCVSIFATGRQVERADAQDRANRTVVTEPHWGTSQRIQGSWAHGTHLKPTSVNTQLKGTSMQIRVINFRCLIRTKKVLQVQYHSSTNVPKPRVIGITNGNLHTWPHLSHKSGTSKTLHKTCIQAMWIRCTWDKNTYIPKGKIQNASAPQYLSFLVDGCSVYKCHD